LFSQRGGSKGNEGASMLRETATFAVIMVAAVLWTFGLLSVVVCLLGAVVTCHPGFLIGSVVAVTGMCAADLLASFVE
jgi:hypothetical protein